MDCHSVYVAFDDEDVCLYVGRTSRGERRMRQHGKASQWWPRVYTMRVQHFASREAAALHEFECIRSLMPEFNVEVPTTLTWPSEYDDARRAAFLKRWTRVTVVDQVVR